MPNEKDSAAFSQARTEGGAFVSTVTDEELWALYQDLGTATKVSRACGLAPRTVRHRLVRIREALGLAPAARNLNVAEAMESLVASVPLSTPSGGKLASIGVNLWEMGAKDDLSQEIVKRGLDKIGATYRFDGKQPLVIIPHESPLRPYALPHTYEGENERVFVIGDLQTGFWCVLDDGDSKQFKFVPFHDEAAIDVMLQCIAIFKPHRIVIIGDFIDFPQLSRFQQEPQWAQTLQATIDYAYDLIGHIRDTAGPECIIDFIKGNHETRIQRAIVNNNPALMNLKKPGDKYSIYSVENLLGFEKRNIIPSAEYPSGEVWLARREGNRPGLVATHADPKKKEMRADSIHGHLVLPGKWDSHTVWEQDGPVTFQRLCVSGCGNYSDRSDSTSLTRTNTPSGRSRMSFSQSFGTVEIDKATGMRHMDYHKIVDGRAKFMGQIVMSNIALEEAA